MGRGSETSRTKVVYNFGRSEDLDRDAVNRLIGSLSRLLGETPANADTQELAEGLPGLEFTESRPLGGTWVLDALWSRLYGSRPTPVERLGSQWVVDELAVLRVA